MYLDVPPPINGVITRGWSEDHPAIDYACVTGRPVWAVADGKTRRYYDPRMGWVVILTSEEGRRFMYAHLDSAGSPRQVKTGDVVGLCGNTGSWSYGPHLHFEF